MGKYINNIEIIQSDYLKQFLEGKYKKVQFISDSIQQQLPFDILFDIHTDYDYVDEVDKSIVCQWLDNKDDKRFKHYMKYYLKPDNLLALNDFSYEDISHLISPHNIVNSEK